MRTKRKIQNEIDVIISFGLGLAVTLILLGSYLFFKLDSTDIVYPITVTLMVIIIRAIVLNRGMK